MQPSHVIIVNDHAFINGGQTKVAIETATGLAARNIKVTYFAACGPVDEALNVPGVTVECLDQKDILDEPNRVRAMTRGIWNRGAARALRKLLADQNPVTTLVHAHGFAKALSPSIGPVLTGSQVPHLFTMHEYFLACPNGGFYDYQAHEICTRKALGVDCLTTNCDVRKPVHKYWRVARQMALQTAGNMPRGLQNIAYISQTELDAMASYMPEGAQLHYLPNPISVDQGPRVAAEDNDAFVFVGRLNPEKGCVDFAKAAKQAGVRAVFVGEGSEREAILAANPDAEITGWVTPAEVETWLTQARALVLPSLWYETFGLVAYEGIAKGVPCIVGGWNAAAEAVTDGETGLVYATRDGLADALTKAQEPALLGQMSKAAYDRYWANPLTPDRYIDRLLVTYNEVMAGNGGRY